MRGNYGARNFVNKCRRLCFTSVLVKMPIAIEGTVNNTPEAHKVQMHGVVLLLQIHPSDPLPREGKRGWGTSPFVEYTKTLSPP
jgi:hypothetical protein